MSKRSILRTHDKLADKFKKLAVQGKYTNAQITEALNAYLQELGEPVVITEKQVQHNRPLVVQDMEMVIQRNKARRELIKKYADTLNKDPDVDALSLASDLLEDMLTRLAVSLDNDNVPDIKAVRELSLIHKSLTESKRIITGLMDKARAEMAERLLQEAAKQVDSNTDTLEFLKRVINNVNNNGNANSQPV